MTTAEGFKLSELLGGGPPPPEGVYTVYMQQWEQAESSTGKPMLKLRWEIANGPYAGRVLYDQIVVSREGIFRAGQILDALGRDRETYYENAAECATDLVRTLEGGEKVVVVLKHKASTNDPSRVYGQIVMYSRYVPGYKEEDIDAKDTPPF